MSSIRSDSQDTSGHVPPTPSLENETNVAKPTQLLPTVYKKSFMYIIREEIHSGPQDTQPVSGYHRTDVYMRRGGKNKHLVGLEANISC